ncbi:MAG: SUMF1/EgtB/PvdO family nonheme iron enzyme [Pseudomonadota bacterium]|uniref:SUMF1/EgtB/PvdO family nonheme iron enzyme n=1 Tax=Candidatus Desulfatibia profunda TaxID=2841695 RepID=A0A8J6NTG4_9BACT|nr:SUMF1/EgtB/PvdO family nonheme iron enzyme [Candidatus Desulfatibia profunda]MBL7180683.1 SUMF1/EgtB/PvdO family nonheme iron enzyme [Desulfobacterales bacterium]MBU0698967.1 SUMF1/EgtB/PvdO family nonheme iron enzyme [Pseudomonadota bacterium]
MKRCFAALQCILLAGILAGEACPQDVKSMVQLNEALFDQLQRVHHLTAKQMSAIRAIFAGSGYMGQGNPAITKHPVTAEQCEEKLAREAIRYENPAFEKICGAKYMAPLYNPAVQKPEDACNCIDQFEFPDIPCAYPVVWVRAKEAAELCEAMGKRLCDAHEWEGACAGALENPDYRFDLAAGQSPEAAIRLMRTAHNHKYGPSKSWSYGDACREEVCAGSSSKTPGCTGGSWSGCGSNTFPAGFFPQCHSPLMVYDLNGNAAEHMNLPLNEKQMASRGSREYGYTEMKGSWFIFDTQRAHEDWCRWRAPYWHGSRVMDKQSHHNYHLGFRCCKTLDRNKAESH